VLQIACNLTLLLGIEKTAARSRVDGITATTTSIMAENSPSAAATQTASHFQFAQLIESRSVCPDPPPHPLKLPVKRLQQVLSHRRWMIAFYPKQPPARPAQPASRWICVTCGPS